MKTKTAHGDTAMGCFFRGSGQVNLFPLSDINNEVTIVRSEKMSISAKNNIRSVSSVCVSSISNLTSTYPTQVTPAWSNIPLHSLIINNDERCNVH